MLVSFLGQPCECLRGREWQCSVLAVQLHCDPGRCYRHPVFSRRCAACFSQSRRPCHYLGAEAASCCAEIEALPRRQDPAFLSHASASNPPTTPLLSGRSPYILQASIICKTTPDTPEPQILENARHSRHLETRDTQKRQETPAKRSDMS